MHGARREPRVVRALLEPGTLRPPYLPLALLTLRKASVGGTVRLLLKR